MESQEQHFASKDITEESADDLPSVQVGDPFQEKLLLEATLRIRENRRGCWECKIWVQLESLVHHVR